MKRDYYEILGIDKHADAQAIKKAFRKLAKKYHPDSNEGNAQAAERFKEVNEAYDVLGDEEKRNLYDRFGHRVVSKLGSRAVSRMVSGAALTPGRGEAFRSIILRAGRTWTIF